MALDEALGFRREDGRGSSLGRIWSTGVGGLSSSAVLVFESTIDGGVDGAGIVAVFLFTLVDMAGLGASTGGTATSSACWVRFSSDSDERNEATSQARPFRGTSTSATTNPSRPFDLGVCPLFVE